MQSDGVIKGKIKPISGGMADGYRIAANRIDILIELM